MDRKIGPLLLSGLMIGPILGSGVILLPPIAYGKLGSGAIWSWLIIMALGALFALIFAKLSIIYPGDGGMTIAIDKVLGEKYKIYASLLIISAVTFGPTAVMLTASEYLKKLTIFNSIPKSVIAMILVVIALIILMKDLKIISTISFILSSVIAVVLVACSILVIANNPIDIAPIHSVDVIPLGRVVFLLFWAIIGWEIVGNYSDQVRDIKKTIPRATIISIIVITLTYMIISVAIQAFPYSETLSLVQILEVVFGRSSRLMLALLVTGLCICTYLLVVGAVARLINSLAIEGYLPKVLSNKNTAGIPYTAILYYIIMHLVVLGLVQFNLINIEGILGIANAFFLANAVIGLIASLKIIDGVFYKIGGVVLGISFAIILSLSSFKIYIALLVVYAITIYMCRRHRGESVC